MRQILLALIATIAWTSAGPARAQSGEERAGERADPSARDARRMAEDVAVFRVLLNRAVEQAYGFPFLLPAHAHRGQPHPTLRDHFVQFAPAEGVYLKGRGVVYSLSAPMPLRDPLARDAA